MVRIAGLALAALLLGSCGGNGDVNLPSPTVTRTASGLPSPTATVPEPTRTPASPEVPERTRTPEDTEPPSPPAPTRTSAPAQAEPSPTKSSVIVVAPTPTQTAPPTSPTETAPPTSPTRTAATPAPTASPSVQPSSSESSGPPSWLWWVLAAVVVLALVIGVLLVVRSRRRAKFWRDDLASAEGEVAWFARSLIPELRRLGSPAEVAGGWNIAASRITAVEDKLTALEPSAPDDAAQNRARSLRDAVRTARGRIDGLLTSPGPVLVSQGLDAVAADLEQALRPPAPPLD